jgi:signal transduction histidine kinase
MIKLFEKNSSEDRIFNTAEKLFMAIIIATILIIIGFNDVTLFHTLIELVGVIIGGCLFVFAINTYKLSPDQHINYIGVTYFFVALFDLLQSLYPPYSPYSLQLSICSKLFQCLILGSYHFKMIKNISIRLVFYIYSVISILLIYSILFSNIFPKSYIIDGSFNFFHISTCYFSIFIFSLAIIMILSRYHSYIHDMKKYLLMYSILVIIYQSSIIIKIPGTNLHLIVIHIVKLVTNYPLFMIITKLAFKDPLKMFFSDLKLKNEELHKNEVLLENKNKELDINNKSLIKANYLILSSQQKYKKLLQFLPHAVLLLKENKVAISNENFNDMFKPLHSDNIHNRDILEIIPVKYKNGLEKILQFVNEGHNIIAKQVRLELEAGSCIDIEYSMLHNVLNDENHTLILVEDITEKLLAQQILNKAKIDEENEKLKIGFMANISHELRTPVNLIYSALQLEEQYLYSGNALGIMKYNTVIKQNCFRLLRIINNLIDATKIDSSFFTPNKKYMNVISLIEDATLSVVPLIESKAMHITFDTDVEEKYMLCDGDLIERIVLNLLSNSVKYGKNNGKIQVSIKDCNDNLVMTFKDDGIGIPKDKKDMLFTRFGQVNKSFSRNAEGSGIGLYLVKHFVEMHEGSIKLESEEGVGTEIVITFPCPSIPSANLDTEQYIAVDLENNSNIIHKVNVEFSDIYMN